MKKGTVSFILTCVLLIGIISSCSTLRTIYGIPEPQESEAVIRKKITTAVDKASSEIISSLQIGIRLAVLGGSSSGGEREKLVSYYKSQGVQDNQARLAV